MTKVWVLQHIHCETLGTIADALEARGADAQYVRSYAGEPVPKTMDGAAGLVVMGGPMGVYDVPRYPFLKDEMRLIEQALKADKPVLGVCLGSQLLAATLGAAVKAGPAKEIGWYPVTLSDAALADPLWHEIVPPFTSFHWHGDIFDLPRGAVLLASSEMTRHQVFRFGKNVYGFLFHMEVTADMIETWVETFAEELRGSGIPGAPILAGISQHLVALHRIGAVVYNRWAALLQDV